MFDAARAATELEEDQLIRQEELVFLENLCGTLHTDEQDRMRRSMLLMLYAHLEGFAKLAFTVYCRHINEAGILCRDVQPELATSALRDVFRAFRNPQGAENFLPHELRNLKELRPLAIERTLVKEAFTISLRTVSLPDTYIDTESNLKPEVLRKNLYRLGLPHDMFDAHESTVGKLLGRRNNIAHGSEVAGISADAYSSMKAAVYSVMDALKMKIVESIQTRAYFRIQHQFRLAAPGATSVMLMGEFNHWVGLSMTKASDGVWSASVSLALGIHAYKFLVDATQWIFDPENSDRIRVGGFENSAIEIR